MSQYVTDTHALIWHLSSDAELSAPAADIFRLADNGQAEIFIPSIVLVEIVNLAERKRVPADNIERIVNMARISGSHYHVSPLDESVVDAMRHIPRADVPDMPDRIIAATALLLDLPLITRDSRISRTNLVRCLW